MSLDVRVTKLPEVKEIIPARFGDKRGYFSEAYNHARFVAHGVDFNWIQDNHSFSEPKHVLRGLHFQTAPYAQDKLVRVATGAVFDVAVDIRKGSPRYGQWVGVTLSAEVGNQLLVPAGFAHGFVTLTENVHVLYKVTAPYSGDHDRSIRYDDPDIGIDWPLNGALPILSYKDEKAARLCDMDTGFRFS